MSKVDNVRHRLGEEIFRRVAGPDADRRRQVVHGSEGPRWFDPDSPIGRVHGDAAMFVGGIRAIMLQSLHPAAMRGVADHSGFKGDMWGRLAKTANFIALTTFGTEHHAQRAIEAVRRVHESVNGTMPDGTPYSATDPHLLAWVHVAELDSFLAAHAAYGHTQLTEAERDTYVAQAAHVAELLGVIDPPRSHADLQAALDGFRPELRGTEAARDAINFLIRHPDLPLTARPGYWALVVSAVGLMPRWTRQELGLLDLPLLDRTAVRGLGHVSTQTVRWAMSPGHAHARRLQADASR